MTAARPRILLVAAICFLAGCSTTSSPGPRQRSGLSPEQVKPFVQPVSPDASVVSRVRVAITPVGSVPYDGLVLPLTSPDGRFLATQVGQAPDWETVLALPGAAAPTRTGIAVYRIDGTNLTTVAQHGGLSVLLGRSCDDRGFLVEAPRPDGSRWIGFIAWEARPERPVRWLVSDDRVNAHATLVPPGAQAGNQPGIAFTSRPVGRQESELVYLGGARRSIRPPEGSTVRFPLFGLDTDLLYVFEQTDRTTALAWYHCGPGALDRMGEVQLVSRRVVEGGSPLQPYQAAVSVTTPARSGGVGVDGGRGGGGGEGELMVFHPVEGRMVTVVPFPGGNAPMSRVRYWMDGSFASAPMLGGAGMLLGTSDGLRYQRDAADFIPGPEASSVSILAGHQIPRVISEGSELGYLLLGAPISGGGFSLEIVMMRLAEDTD